MELVGGSIEVNGCNAGDEMKEPEVTSGGLAHTALPIMSMIRRIFYQWVEYQKQVSWE